ncbi:MAG: ABC transporter permease [Muribaculaceae bacterium]|nr:ABC transporter permease [Muribaculaceae bacterium]
MTNHIMLIIKREYLSRVRRKSFILSTFLLPIFFIAMIALPTVIAVISGPEDKKIAIIDQTSYISKAFLNNEDMMFEVSDQSVDSLKNREDIDAILIIPENVVDKPDNLILYTNGSIAMQTEMYIKHILNNAIEQIKLSRYNIDNLEEIINEVKTNVGIKTIRIDGEDEKESSSFASYMAGMLLAFLLYMIIMMYGQMVMTSIIEEKNNRVLEIVVSSIKPVRLMLGKILGIGAVAVTQILIWGVLIGAFSLTVMPSLLTKAITSGGDVELMQIVSALGAPGYLMGLFGVMIAFLILGYMFYSSIYAAIGSAVDNIQDASQLQMFALAPILIGMIFAMSILNDPNSELALWLSMIPFTSPIVMMARLPFGIAAWQIVVSLIILAVTTVFVVWISAKIYRVGIFMYGKKPNIKDLIRWTRYK